MILTKEKGYETMNKYQEALDEFWEAYVDLIGRNKKTIILKNGDYEHDFIKYKKSLQELVDKATPKKPKRKLIEKEDLWNETITIVGIDICDDCKNQVQNNQKFCKHCGQALDWSEDEPTK